MKCSVGLFRFVLNFMIDTTGLQVCCYVTIVDKTKFEMSLSVYDLSITSRNV